MRMYVKRERAKNSLHSRFPTFASEMRIYEKKCYSVNIPIADYN